LRNSASSSSAKLACLSGPRASHIVTQWQ
jgi:hypothetical protein